MDLHDQLTKAGSVEPRPLDVAELHGRARGRQRRRRVLASTAALVSVVALGGLAWAGTRPDAKPRQQVTADGGAPADTTSSVAPDQRVTGPPVTTWAEPGVSVTTPSQTTVTGDPGGSATGSDAGSDAATTVPVTTAPPAATTTSVAPVNPGGPTNPGGTVIGGTRTMGSYHGNEQYRIGGTCPQVTQHLVATFTTDDGAVWSYEAHVCGRTEGDTWYGVGTGVFGLPGGDDILVSIDESTPYPTTGVPYHVDITGGTGAHAGASGRCDLTIHITPKGFGSQDQDGTFTCDVAVRPHA